MKLSKFLKASNYRITDGSEYLWSCYPNAMYCDVSDVKGRGIGSCLFSTINRKVYEIAVSIPSEEKMEVEAFRWIDPKFTDAYFDECEKRNINPSIAWDDVKWMDFDKTSILGIVHDLVECNYETVRSIKLPVKHRHSLVLTINFETIVPGPVSADLVKNWIMDSVEDCGLPVDCNVTVERDDASLYSFSNFQCGEKQND